MKLAELGTNHVRGLRDGTFTFGTAQDIPAVTVITGPPCCGLTSILDAIGFTAARLATGGILPVSDDLVTAGSERATVRSVWKLDAEEQAYGGVVEDMIAAEVYFPRGALPRAETDPALFGVMSRYDHLPSTSKVVLVPVKRAGDEASSMTDFVSEQRLVRLSSSAGRFAGLARAVVNDAHGSGDPRRFEQVQRLFAELCRSAQLSGVSSNGQPEFSLTSGARIPLSKLAHSERQAFVFAAAPVLLGLASSVVLVDTPELGLEPGMASRWMGALAAFAPSAQWIVATRDPVLIESATHAIRLPDGRGGR